MPQGFCPLWLGTEFAETATEKFRLDFQEFCHESENYEAQKSGNERNYLLEEIPIHPRGRGLREDDFWPPNLRLRRHGPHLLFFLQSEAKAHPNEPPG